MLSDGLDRQACAGGKIGRSPSKALALFGDSLTNGSLVVELCGFRGGWQESRPDLLRSSSASADGCFRHGFLGFTRTIEPTTRRVEPTLAQLIIAAC